MRIPQPPKFTMREFYWVREQRERYGIPYKKIAEAFELVFNKHISYRTIHRWEREVGWEWAEASLKRRWEKHYEATFPRREEYRTEEEYRRAREEWREARIRDETP